MPAEQPEPLAAERKRLLTEVAGLRRAVLAEGSPNSRYPHLEDGSPEQHQHLLAIAERMLRVAQIDLAIHEAACQCAKPSTLPEREAELVTLTEWRNALLREADELEVMRRDTLRARDVEAERVGAMQTATLRLQRAVLRAKDEVRSRQRAVCDVRPLAGIAVYATTANERPRRAV